MFKVVIEKWIFMVGSTFSIPMGRELVYLSIHVVAKKANSGVHISTEYS
jgi:hypothetical protein